MRRGYSYKRFSSPRQARGDSIRRQTEFEQRIVKEMDLLLDDTLDLSDTGVSAFHGKNSKFGALAEFMAMVESGRIPTGSVLIVENLDRLSRENVFDAFNLFSRIIGADITIVTSDDVYDKATVQGNIAKLMVPLVYMMRAHDESKTKSMRIHHAWNQRRKKAAEEGQPLTERCPMWLRVRDGKYEVREDRAAVVRLVHQLVREGLGVGRIVAQLVHDAVPTIGWKGKWTHAYVRKLLTWPAVYGEMQPHLFKEGKKVKHGDPVPNYYPAVISREEFELNRATMRQRKVKEGVAAGGDINLLTSICWHVGDRCKMSVRSTKTGGKRYAYIRSNLCDRGFQPKDARQFPYELLEAAVLDLLADLLAGGEDGRLASGEEERVCRLAHELSVIEDCLRGLMALVADPGREVCMRTAFSQLAELEAARAARQDELDRARAAVAPHPVVALVQAVRAAPDGEARDGLRRRLRRRLGWLVGEMWVHIEKVNHVRAFAHVQVFLRSGAMRYAWVPSFRPAGRGPVVGPARTYADVDFRTYTLSDEERRVGRGRLRDRK